MDWNALPQERAATLAAIDAARADGPPATARLTILCLWLAGQASDPLKSYEGPSGDRPLQYVEGVLQFAVLDAAQDAAQKDRPVPDYGDFITYGAHVREDYPRPRDPRQRETAMESEEARRLVGRAVGQIKSMTHVGDRSDRCLESLASLWERGASRADLEPLFKIMWPASEEYLRWGDDTGFKRAQMVKALMHLGEWDQALEIVEATALPDEAALKLRIEGARWLIATARPDLARAMLDRLLAQRDQFPRAHIAYKMRDLAGVFVYLGDEATARKLRPSSQQLWDSVQWESVVALGKYYNQGVADPAALLKLLEQTRSIEPPKSRAAMQYDILEPLLAIEAYDAAWRTLDYIQATLLATPTWGKREHRTDGVVQVLLPYLDKHSARIHQFAAGLLVGTAQSIRDFWDIMFVVSGLRWLIWSWTGSEGIAQIVDFVRRWQANPQWKQADGHAQAT